MSRPALDAAAAAIPPPLRLRIFVSCWALTALFNVVWGIVFPLRALYFREPEIGLSYAQLGWLGFIRSGVAMVAPLTLGILSDRNGRRKPWILAGFLGASVSTTAYLFGHRFADFAGIILIDVIAMSAFNLNVNALVTLTLSDKARGRQYGVYRISGSIGFAFSNFLLVPLVSGDATYRAPFLVGSAVYLLAALVGFFGIREMPARSGARPEWRAWREVFRHRNLTLLYACMAFGSIGSSMGWQFFANHLDETYGLSKNSIGIFYGIQTLTEIPALILLGSASDRWGRKPILVLAYLIGGIRWALIGFAPTTGWIIVAQLLWGLGFSGWVVAVALIVDLVEPRARATALGMMNLAFGFGSMIGPPIGGYLADHVGLPFVYRFGAGFSIITGLILLALFRSPTNAGPTPSPDAAPPVSSD